MRTATLDGRLVLVRGAGADLRGVDVHTTSGGRFAADPLDALERWPEFCGWAGACADKGAPIVVEDLGPPVPRPRQVFGIGLNYRAHAAEASVDVPEGMPPTFTKFPSSLAGPVGDLSLPAGSVDWEVELVVVIGREGTAVSEADAWEHVAGLCVGQDYSERQKQTAGPVPQFSLGKSHAGFAPFGPVLVSLDEIESRDDLAIECTVNGETVQKDRTSSMIFPVAALIERLSSVVTLYPGDVIFTGTPSGVGMARTPPVFLKPGDEVVSRIEGLGELRQVCVDGAT
jgi:2-keto-4-pentenoate hydratase/2-oxohepta-3-ene-1,7-dioic acid hydratase in catechol pathway